MRFQSESTTVSVSMIDGIVTSSNGTESIFVSGSYDTEKFLSIWKEDGLVHF